VNLLTYLLCFMHVVMHVMHVCYMISIKYKQSNFLHQTGRRYRTLITISTTTKWFSAYRYCVLPQLLLLLQLPV